MITEGKSEAWCFSQYKPESTIQFYLLFFFFGCVGSVAARGLSLVVVRRATLRCDARASLVAEHRI